MPKVFRLKIELADIKPAIWRRIVVPSSLTLVELHAVIQGAMGWEDSHLHLFEIGGKRYEMPDDSGFGPEPGVLDETRVFLEEVLSGVSEFSYEYDFGDGWRHHLIVEDRKDGDARSTVTDGARACPPEDCGGPWGYPEFLDALADPSHPEHEDTKNWAGPFKPEAFSVAEANKLVNAVCALYREQGLGFGG